MRTVPVNQSAGPAADGCEPPLVTFIATLLRSQHTGWRRLVIVGIYSERIADIGATDVARRAPGRPATIAAETATAEAIR